MTANKLDIPAYWQRYLRPDALSSAQSKLRDSNEPSVHLILSSAPQMKHATYHANMMQQCFKLVEANAAADYRQSEMKWSAISKRAEMVLPDMRYIVVARGAVNGPTHSEGVSSLDSDVLSSRDSLAATSTERSVEVLGFISFMATFEDGHEVIYIYEIHLSEECQGQGIGPILMDLVEGIGTSIGTEKIMLTVFVANQRAVKWYKKLGYGVDDFSPGPRVLRDGRVKQPTYTILSKRIVSGVEEDTEQE